MKKLFLYRVILYKNDSSSKVIQNLVGKNKILSLSFFRWVCDNEPDCGSAPSGKLDESDEDPARCRGNVTCDGNNFLCKVRYDDFYYCMAGQSCLSKV